MDSVPVWIWVTTANSFLVCLINASVDSWVTFGFVVARDRALMESLVGNDLNRINFEFSS